MELLLLALLALLALLVLVAIVWAAWLDQDGVYGFRRNAFLATPLPLTCPLESVVEAFEPRSLAGGWKNSPALMAVQPPSVHPVKELMYLSGQVRLSCVEKMDL